MSRKLSLFVFVDALGWEISSQREFLADLLTVRAPLQTVLGYSATCLPTILTGRMPCEHGHFTFFCRPADEPLGPLAETPFRGLGALRWLPSGLAERGRVRRVLSRAVAASRGLTGYFQLYNVPFEELECFDYSEKRDIYQPGGINGGHPTIFDHLREREVAYHMSDWRRPESENLASLRCAVEQGQIEFAWLYLPALDGRLHDEGLAGRGIESHLQRYERELRSLLALAERHYGEVSLTVFSDHGMADVRESWDLMARVEATGLRRGSDYLAVYDSTMARFWFANGRAESRLRELLGNEARGRILEERDLRQLGCWFEDARYGQLIYLVEAGTLICPSFMGRKPLRGMHGYDPCDRASVATFASTHAPRSVPHRLDDMYSVMREAVA